MNTTKDIPVELVVGVVLFLLISALAALFFRKIRFPYTVGLVVLGAGLGVVAPLIPSLAPLQQVRLTPHLILYIFLPTLLFEAALNLDVPLLKKNLVPVLALAILGLVVATMVTGFLLALLPGFSLYAALLFGVLISATDPVAVIALFKEVGAPKRLTMLVDGESLFNDATAIVGFTVLMGVITSGTITGATWLAAGVQFLMVFAGGFAVGVGIGFIMVGLLKLVQGDPLIYIALTTVTAYVSFIVADHFLHLSGVMCVVGAGIVMSAFINRQASSEIKQYLHHFWSYAVFVCNSFIFLLLGFTESRMILGVARVHYMVLGILFAIVVVLVARAISVWACDLLVRGIQPSSKLEAGERKILIWGSLRGALPVGLAMTIAPSALGPNGEKVRLTILGLLLGVVLFSLLVQGTTLHKYMTKLGMVEPDKH